MAAKVKIRGRDAKLWNGVQGSWGRWSAVETVAQI